MRLAGAILPPLLAAICTAGGCMRIAAYYTVPTVPECNSIIPSPGNLRGDFARRLRMHIEAEQVSEGFEVVLQKRGDRITVVGLTRFRAKAFTIVQQGDRIETRSAMGPIQAVPPRNVLGDLYHWPLGIVATPGVSVDAAADGRSATIVNQRCGYRTTLVDTSDERH